jgi:hypothetical protein
VRHSSRGSFPRKLNWLIVRPDCCRWSTPSRTRTSGRSRSSFCWRGGSASLYLVLFFSNFVAGNSRHHPRRRNRDDYRGWVIAWSRQLRAFCEICSHLMNGQHLIFLVRSALANHRDCDVVRGFAVAFAQRNWNCRTRGSSVSGALLHNRKSDSEINMVGEPATRNVCFWSRISRGSPSPQFTGI